MTAIGQMIREVYAYRELLVALTYRDIRVKYKQAVMGMLWAFFMPVLAILSGIVFRMAMAFFSGKPLIVADITAVMIKSVPWLLFASIVGSSSTSLISNMALITKIYFPREVVPLSSLLSSLFDFSIAVTGLIAALALIALFAGSDPPPLVISLHLLWVPLLLMLLVLMAAGLGLILSCANLFLRDVKYIVSVLLQFGIFFSLVYFTHEELGRWGKLLLLNPVAPLLEGLRLAVVDGRMDPMMLGWIAYSAAVAVTVFAVSTVVFDRAEYLFAEYV